MAMDLLKSKHAWVLSRRLGASHITDRELLLRYNLENERLNHETKVFVGNIDLPNCVDSSLDNLLGEIKTECDVFKSLNKDNKLVFDVEFNSLKVYTLKKEDNKDVLNRLRREARKYHQDVATFKMLMMKLTGIVYQV